MRSLPLPSCPQAQQWIAYCNLELTHNLFDRVEAIFARCCRSSTSVDLWRFYLDYIRRVNPIDPANIELAKQARAIIGARSSLPCRMSGTTVARARSGASTLRSSKSAGALPLPFFAMPATCD